MEKNFKNRHRCFIKCIQVISSCKTKDQLDTARNMIYNFYKMFDQYGFLELYSIYNCKKFSLMNENS